MEQLTTTYTVKIESGGIWQFKYNLNGVLIHFNVMEGELSTAHSDWLYKKGKFPYLEDHIKDWKKKLKQLTIEVGEPDFSFEALWDFYGNKVSKFDAQKSFNKLSQADKIKCFLATPGYKKYLAKKQTGTAHLATFINRQYYHDDWVKAT
ncbi:hypothetical protein [Flavobacterium degerlachei]|jgi:hypothetical protein|uniref:Uncharacterized protein n=1 Tax=Flavobacterium degerlachei TaxID=229203 RepID=A0A1H2Z085_9FLAO|nr:hypothetical protein [Flavobacterium degerlachei]SDX10747.1 hypothetical protein SAMN05444338_10746 [Flavobacterium degerlachei]